MRRLLLLLVVLLPLILPTPTAGAPVDPLPTLRQPLSANTADGTVAVQIEGARNLWGTRRVAAYVDDRVPGLRIYRAGTCAARPWAHCVRVVVRSYGNTSWWALTYWYTDPLVIKLNTTYGPLQDIACHELMHVLGMDHHARGGCGSTTSPARYPTVLEVQALRAAYPARH